MSNALLYARSTTGFYILTRTGVGFGGVFTSETRQYFNETNSESTGVPARLHRYTHETQRGLVCITAVRNSVAEGKICTRPGHRFPALFASFPAQKYRLLSVNYFNSALRQKSIHRRILSLNSASSTHFQFETSIIVA